MNLISRFYDEASVFDDSLIIIALFLIFNKKTDDNIIELKTKLEDLVLSDSIVDSMIELQENYRTKEFKQIVNQLSDIDGLIQRYYINDNILKHNKQVIKSIRKRYKLKRKQNAKSK